VDRISDRDGRVNNEDEDEDDSLVATGKKLSDDDSSNESGDADDTAIGADSHMMVHINAKNSMGDNVVMVLLLMSIVMFCCS